MARPSKRRLYLPVEIDGKRRAALIDAALGLPRHSTIGGLLDLWEHVWREKRDVVAPLYLDACLGSNEKLRAAMVEAGFIEPVEGGFRVRGAAEWLFGNAKRGAAGGRKTAEQKRSFGNLKQFSEPNCTDSPKQTPKRSRSGVRGNGTNSVENSEATPKPTQHPTPNTQTTKSDPGADAAGVPSPNPLELELQDPKRDPVGEVVGHYVEAMGANGIATRDTPAKREMVAKRLKAGNTVDELKQAINGLTWSDFHMGRDPKTGGQKYAGLEYAIGDSERIEANIQRAQSPPSPPQRAGGWR